MATRKFTTELEELLAQIEETIRYMTITAEQKGVSVYELKHMDGTYAMERILLAKAHAMHTVALVNSQATMLVKNQNQLEKELYDPDLQIRPTPIELFQDDVRDAIRLRNEQIWGK